MVATHDLEMRDGHILRVHDSADDGMADAFTLLLHHGSPQTGAPLAPLLTAAAARGIRLLSYGRPSYGGSTPRPGRNVAAAAADVAAITDRLGVDRFAVMGHSSGAVYALACGALLPNRVTGVAALAALAPIDATGLDFFAGMIDPGALRAAATGDRAARATFEETAEFNPESFDARDYAVLRGEWASLGADVGRAGAAGPDGIIDDDVALARPWGFDVTTVAVPVLLVHGGEDRVAPPAHVEWLVRHMPDVEFWFRPRDGHLAVLTACPLAMDWLIARA